MATLGQLHDALNWSTADQAQGTLQQTDGFFGTDRGFLRRWRCALLEAALYASDTQRRDSAIRLLQQANVWPDVLPTCKRLGVPIHGTE